MLEPRTQTSTSSPAPGTARRALARFRRPEIIHQFDHIFGELVDVSVEIAPHRPRRDLIRTGGTAKTKVDASGMQRRERAELFGDQQRRVIRQHDAARADADRAGGHGDMGQSHCRRRAGDSRHVMVFGHPVAPEAQRLHMTGEVDRIAQRLAGVTAFGNGRKIEDGQRDHPHYIVWDARKQNIGLGSDHAYPVRQQFRPASRTLLRAA